MAELSDLLDAHPNVERGRETYELTAERFQSAKARTEAGVRHFVGGVVTNDGGEFVLVQNEWSDGWIVPGGGVEVGETLREALVREIREETGLDARVEDPVAIVDQTFVHGEESIRNAFVAFEAIAETTELADDPGIDDDEIGAVEWFDSVPDNCKDAGLLESALEN